MTFVQRARSFGRTWDHPQGAASAVLGGYRLLTELAVGELCSVSLARSLQSSPDAGVVAIKRLRAPHQNSGGRSRLLREARVLLSLRAPNLVRVLEIHTQPELFVVMEHVPGASLRALLARAREVDALRYIVPIFVDALRGLSVLHNWKDEDGAPGFLVHQAPTARHMLVGMDGVARLIDLSHVHGRQLGTAESAFTGERGRAAPEQLASRAALDPRCDIFIVGTALLEALACARDARAARLSESHVRARLGSLFAIGQRARSSEKSARFWSADEMAYALQKAADEADLYADRAAVGAYVQRVLALEAVPEPVRVSRAPSSPPPLPSFIAAPVPRPCVPPPAPAAEVEAPLPRPERTPHVVRAAQGRVAPRAASAQTVAFAPRAEDVAVHPQVTVPRASFVSAHPTPTGLRGSAHDASALRLPTTTRTQLGVVLGSGAVIFVLLLAALRTPAPAPEALPNVHGPAAREAPAPAEAQLPQSEPLHPVVTSIVTAPMAPPAHSLPAGVAISIPRVQKSKLAARVQPPGVPRARVPPREEEARELPVLDLYEDGLRSLSPRLPSNPYE